MFQNDESFELKKQAGIIHNRCRRYRWCPLSPVVVQRLALLTHLRRQWRPPPLRNSAFCRKMNQAPQQAGPSQTAEIDDVGVASEMFAVPCAICEGRTSSRKCSARSRGGPTHFCIIQPVSELHVQRKLVGNMTFTECQQNPKVLGPSVRILPDRFRCVMPPQ